VVGHGHQPDVAELVQATRISPSLSSSPMAAASAAPLAAAVVAAPVGLKKGSQQHEHII
jgi:hypothetical protein